MALPPNTADSIEQIIADTLRPLVTDFMPDSCEIQRRQLVSDGRGGTVETWATIATTRCTVDVSTQTGTGEYVVGSVEAVEILYDISLPYDTDVTEEDRIVSNGRTFAVNQAAKAEGYGVDITALCRELIPPPEPLPDGFGNDGFGQ